MAGKRKISLVLADVAGTLVTEEKVLTKRAPNAVRALQSAGILAAREIATIGDQPNDVLTFKGVAFRSVRSGAKQAPGEA